MTEKENFILISKGEGGVANNMSSIVCQEVAISWGYIILQSALKIIQTHIIIGSEL